MRVKYRCRKNRACANTPLLTSRVACTVRPQPDGSAAGLASLQPQQDALSFAGCGAPGPEKPRDWKSLEPEAASSWVPAGPAGSPVTLLAARSGFKRVGSARVGCCSPGPSDHVVEQ